MSQYDPYSGREQDPSLDALLESARQEYMEQPYDSFEPDFGHAFDDYGEYRQEQLPPQAEQQYYTAPRRKRHLKRMKFPTIIKVLLYLVAVAVLGIVLATVGWYLADDVLALTRPDMDVEITINDTDSLEDITDALKQAGAVRYGWLFIKYCEISGYENYFDPGVYTINLTYDYHALVNHLMASAGTRETVTLMIVEGADCDDIFTLLEENGVCSRINLEQCAAEYHFNYSFLRGIPYGSANRLEGYLFPDTYQFYLKDSPENVLDRFLKNFENRMDEEMMEQVRDSDYSLREVITMASIVEAEAANDEERALIASVMYNRLNNWELPLLGMDSTVYYAAAQMGTTFSTELDSPYNTYRYPGIPAGPINNPGMNSIRAVLNPEQTDYYYFATATDGHNRFFHSEEEFLNFLASDEYQTIIP